MLRESLEGKTDRQRHFISRKNCCPSRPQLGRHSFQKKKRKKKLGRHSTPLPLTSTPTQLPPPTSTPTQLATTISPPPTMPRGRTRSNPSSTATTRRQWRPRGAPLLQLAPGYNTSPVPSSHNRQDPDTSIRHDTRCPSGPPPLLLPFCLGWA